VLGIRGRDVVGIVAVILKRSLCHLEHKLIELLAELKKRWGS
jgi:hypothetical protein